MISPRRTSKARRLAREEQGIAAVEFALVLPVLIAMLFGTIEIGRLLSDFHVISKGVRDGARYLSRVDVDCPAIGGGTFQDAAEKTKGLNLVMTGSIDAPVVDSDYLLLAWTDAGTTLDATVTCNDPATLEGIYLNLPAVPTVTVAASVKYDFIGALFFLPDFLQIPFSHTEISIGD